MNENINQKLTHYIRAGYAGLYLITSEEQRAEAAFAPLTFDGEAARAYGRIYAAEVARGRKARGTRALDLLIAATACAAGLPIYTRNPEDFQRLLGLVDVVAV